ncbi:unnamed protein product [Prorocentrum cordatum]|uniref:CASP-like protein n=1 Tax=Prorocentrum cordatum TaxID=2364126 RepID=A0ABN9SV91_9DINO|nr:unnamed protein product [Polarella glacialis]
MCPHGLRCLAQCWLEWSFFCLSFFFGAEQKKQTVPVGMGIGQTMPSRATAGAMLAAEAAALLRASAEGLVGELRGVHAAGLRCLLLVEVYLAGAMLAFATAAALGPSPVEVACERGQPCDSSMHVDVRLVCFLLMFLAGAVLNCKAFLGVPLL